MCFGKMGKYALMSCAFSDVHPAVFSTSIVSLVVLSSIMHLQGISRKPQFGPAASDDRKRALLACVTQLAVLGQKPGCCAAAAGAVGTG
jgi:hypothetical protein